MHQKYRVDTRPSALTVLGKRIKDLKGILLKTKTCYTIFGKRKTYALKDQKGRLNYKDEKYLAKGKHMVKGQTGIIICVWIIRIKCMRFLFHAYI
jgi:hypothetical protein